MAITPDRALLLANSAHEIGYAAGGDDTDWPAIQSLIHASMIRLKVDRSYRDIATGKWKSRLIYELTDKGVARLKQLGEVR